MKWPYGRVNLSPGLLIWIRTFFTGSRSYPGCKVEKSSIYGTNIFNFFRKKINIKILEEVWLIWNKFRCLNSFYVSASKIRIWIWIQIFKFWFSGYKSGQKWTGYATLFVTQIILTKSGPECWLRPKWVLPTSRPWIQK